jgi:hypothetical protein
MGPWRCRLCYELLPAEEIVYGSHIRNEHADVDPYEYWPDGSRWGDKLFQVLRPERS